MGLGECQCRRKPPYGVDPMPQTWCRRSGALEPVIPTSNRFPRGPHLSKLVRAIRDPKLAISVLSALALGGFYKWWYPFRGLRFKAGKNLRVFGRLEVRGPGRVAFGDNVTVGMRVTPFTHHVDATITIGSHCFLNGVRFGCAKSIDIGEYCILAESRIMDSNFHSTRADRWSANAPVRVKAVILARNVWVAADAGILPGTEIGENSVVGFGSVCSGRYPANSLIAGNPAVVVRDIEPSPTDLQSRRKIMSENPLDADPPV